MQILNRFARPPRSWPIPRDPVDVGESVRYAEERDPIGTAVHLSLAMVFCASIALSTAMTSASFVLLVGYTLLRVPNLWRSLVPLAASPIVWLWVAWATWTAINGFRSADLERWRDVLGSFWCIALFPALYPLTARWRLLIGAFVAGAAFQAMFQIAQIFGFLLVPITSTGRLPGIGSHPGHVTTSAAIASVILVAWLREIRSVAGLVTASGALGLAILSMALGAGRGALLGATGGMAVAFAALTLRSGVPWRDRGLQAGIVITLLMVGLTAGLTALGHGPASLEFQLAELGKREDRDASSVSKRLLWWSVSLDAFRDEPIWGIGTGSLESYSAVSPRTAAMSAESGLTIEELVARSPHSMYMIYISEQGLLGIAFLGSLIMLTLTAAWRATGVRPIACGILGGLVAWLVAATFESLNLPLRTASIFILLTVLVALPRGPGAGLEPWRNESGRI